MGLHLEAQGRTLLARVDRGDDNLFSGAMIETLTDAILAAGRAGDIRFVRVSARGPAFCLGRERAGRSVEALRAEAARIVRLNEVCRTSPLTIVAEVQGDAAGFGAGLVAASDVAIASEGASFWFPEIHGGLAPTIVIGWLAGALPYKVAFDLVVTGRAISAAEACVHGLVTRVVAPGDLTVAVDNTIAHLSDRNAHALREIKGFFALTRDLDAAAAAAASVDALVASNLRLNHARTEGRCDHAASAARRKSTMHKSGKPRRGWET